MKSFVVCLLAVFSCSAFAQTSTSKLAERLGTVRFATSCAPGEAAAFDRGVALLHDFWYGEAGPQFKQIAKADPGCAMAHWGEAMSVFHEIWDRPDASDMKRGWAEMQKAQALGAKTEREREYIAALADFYKPGPADFVARVTAYSAAMGRLYEKYPEDVDAGAFYALSLLAAKGPNDTSLTPERKAMDVLGPLWAKAPDDPGVVHYIIHACDNPAMAAEGLKAAEHYGEIAPAGAHAVHMPGHIFARLGMWPQDIQSQLDSIAASEAADKRGESGIMDEPHSYDFLMYAYLQSGQDAKAKAALKEVGAVLDRVAAMPGGGHGLMAGRNGYYRTKFPVFYALERRDWKSASELQPVAGAWSEQQTMTWWARAIADGHLHRAEAARADLSQYDALISEMRKGSDAYAADSTGAQIERDEVVAWADFASGKKDDALASMRKAADLQDKVGQAEVDIPAREMLGDMLLESHEPRRALAEYRVSLKLSPGRFNGLYHAGVAAEESGDKEAAARFFTELLRSTDGGAESSRPELAKAKAFVAGEERAGS